VTRDDKRHYWLIHLDGREIDWETYTVGELRDTFIEGLENKRKYISVINKKGVNMCATSGHNTKSLEDEDFIEIFDEEGNLDIMETANAVAKDFLDNRAIVGMRFEKDMYDELGNDKSWINGILGDD
jgi:hypothetical protein